MIPGFIDPSANEQPRQAEFGLLAMTGIPCEFHDAVTYLDGVAQMEARQAARRAGGAPDSVLYFEHEAVITRGRATPPGHILAEAAVVPVVEVPRGGMATWHGPGQLVGYPVIDLSRRAGGRAPDIHHYIRALEDGLAAYLRARHDLGAFARAGHTGVWVGEPASPRKIASIGVSARRWVSGHGFALNVNPDLRAFRAIMPCGLDPAVMTSVERELRRARRSTRLPAMRQVARTVHVYVCEALRAAGFAPTEDAAT